MNLIHLIIGIFCGIGVCMGTLYSIGQVILTEGWTRWLNLFAVIAMGAVMWFLLERDAGLAQLLSPVLILACLGTLIVERRFYKILPALQMVFAVVLFLGYVQFA
ncbi:MAG: hypothetical protein AAGI70_15330 [Pseudomonadota bacterium]